MNMPALISIKMQMRPMGQSGTEMLVLLSVALIQLFGIFGAGHGLEFFENPKPEILKLVLRDSKEPEAHLHVSPSP